MAWGILLGLGASLGWGVSSFLAGQQARQVSPLLISIWSQIVGGLVLLVLLIGSGTAPTGAGFGWGVVAGLFGSSALVLFYRGMALGQVSLVTPIASCGALVPVLAGLASGEPLSWWAGAGIMLALAGIVLVSLRSGAQRGTITRERAALGYALGAALCFGLFFVFAGRGVAAAAQAPLWVTIGGRAGGLTLLLGIQVLRTQALPWPDQRRIVQLGTLGVIDTAATATFTLAALAPNLGLVAVLGSLYPVVTILLSRLVLAERLTRLQSIGVGLSLAGIALIAVP
jgi:drug/metabolite transporter (DMT)-like permease